MKIKMNQELIGIDGKPIVNCDMPPMKLKEVCINSLLSPTEGDDEKKKFERWEIYKKLRDAQNEVELTIEDLASIKKCIGKFQPPLILGQCFEMLEKVETKEPHKGR
jgi:hypothetical protein